MNETSPFLLVWMRVIFLVIDQGCKLNINFKDRQIVSKNH